jgi:hypothetical protein
MFRYAAALIFLALVAGLSACENTTAPPTGAAALPYFQILKHYDTTNLVGVVVIKRYDKHVLARGSSGAFEEYSEVYAHADATFSDGGCRGADVQQIAINSLVLQRSGVGTYYSGNLDDLHLRPDSGSNFVRVTELAGSNYGSLSDSVTFLRPPKIESVRFLDTLPRQGMLHITWSGNGKGFVSAEIEGIAPDGIHSWAVGYASDFLPNAGEAELKIEPRQLTEKLASLSLTQYEPIFRTLSSGKRVCFLLAATNEITVNVKP